MQKPTQQEYKKAHKKLQLSSNDKIGRFATLGSIGLGASAGALATTSLTSTLGISTLLGSTTLASIAGGVFVVSNPIGWGIATTTAGAGIAYGLTKTIANASFLNCKKEQLIKDISKKLE